MKMGTYPHGVGIRKVDDLVRALGADTGIQVPQFPYVYLDATTARTGSTIG
jgi:hypothetical protein